MFAMKEKEMSLENKEYDSFGNIISDSNPDFEIPFGFAGGLYDKDSKLVRFGARDYDPETGRWTSKEPLGFYGSNNFYVYTNGDPVNYVDWNGEKPGEPFKTEEAAAVDALKYIMSTSRAFDAEFGGLVYQKGDCFYATEPMRNSYSNRNFSIPGQLLLDSEASYHTHPNKSANNFTIIDISTNSEYFTNGYVMVDSGDIYKHDVASGEIKWISSDTGNPKNDFNYYDYYGISYE